MKLILRAYTKQSELMFELVQDADTSIGVLMIFESDQGSTSGVIFFESSVVEKNEKTSLKYDHFIEEVADPFIFVDLHF